MTDTQSAQATAAAGVRKTLVLPDEVVSQAESRAKEERRSFNNYVRVLIEEDVQRDRERKAAAAGRGVSL
jgi:hypothetical protein